MTRKQCLIKLLHVNLYSSVKMQMSSKLEVLIFLVAEALLTTPHNILQKKKPNKKIMLQGQIKKLCYKAVVFSLAILLLSQLGEVKERREKTLSFHLCNVRKSKWWRPSQLLYYILFLEKPSTNGVKCNIQQLENRSGFLFIHQSDNYSMHLR